MAKKKEKPKKKQAILKPEGFDEAVKDYVEFLRSDKAPREKGKDEGDPALTFFGVGD